MAEKNSSSKTVVRIIIAAILIGALFGTLLYCAVTGTKVSDLFGQPSSTPTTVVSKSENATIRDDASNDTPTTTSPPSTSTTVATNNLVLPKEVDYVERHDVEIWSEEIEYDEYINMRYGPSKENYDVVKKVQNGTPGYGLTESINGWVFVEVEGTKGWVRDDLVIHGGGGIAKPVLYLYPKETMDVSV